MTGLTDKQAAGVLTMLDMAPDRTVGALAQALAADLRASGAMAEIRDLVRAELEQRRVRAAVFHPIARLCAAERGGRKLGFPPSTLAAVWRGLKAHAPDEIAAAAATFRDLRDPDAPEPEVFDQLCRRAAKGLREPAAAYAAAARLLDADQAGGAEAFAICLDLAPIVRGALRRLPDWFGRMSDEGAAAARLAYADSVAVSAGAGPWLFDILALHLDEPWMILRVLSAVMDRPGDSYVSGSEVARFGEQLLDEVDTRLDTIKHFDGAGDEAALAAARSVDVAARIVAQFESDFDLSRDGPWGRRIAQQKQTLAAVVEARLRALDKALAAALPVQPQRGLGRQQRNVPRLSEELDLGAVDRADAMLVFLQATRVSAGHAGFGVAWQKASEAAAKQIDQYSEDLLDLLHVGDAEDPGRVRRFLDAAARLTRRVNGDRAAEVMRRRAAAA
ncbi:hypothetical protein C5708_12800 [Caulobacter sp. CCUG 60055]|uniref:hypothetical protein n=1 Tax=Caulobacter sp. CCUG 60055 TaxID=2100090 RepID=UPI001FA76B60|nr:hypothetical protein [Caulobacter sp. CCUG 60055]MBQ1542855.1 hypothetical protein [Caulobacteraceae bacterium]MCI3181132.1 hypothetical protein [Caulobacter sp. CCUG 60055]